MWWSAGGTAGGYLYCHLMSSPQPLWQFAPSDKTNLIDVMPQDFLTTFVSMGDKTNGLAAFGQIGGDTAFVSAKGKLFWLGWLATQHMFMRWKSPSKT
jgi:hypothetical protein